MERTTQQQSERLIDLGVPVATYDEMIEGVPTWTFDTLMKMLPATITIDGTKHRLYLCKSGSGAYTMWYRPIHGGKSFMTLIDRSMLNLAYRAIIHLKEGGYVKMKGWPKILNLPKDQNKAYKIAERLRKEE